MVFARVVSVGALSAGVLYSLNRRKAYCNPTNYPFDTKGIPSLVPSAHIAPNAASNPLHLVGVGMRRKFLIIADFDVYLVGLALSNESLKKAVEWANTAEESRKPLSSYVLTPNAKPSQQKSVKGAIVIHMVRGASKSQFVEAFREAFAGVSDENFHAFQPLLEACMGDKGMAAKDEMCFFFMNDNSLVLAKNGEYKGTLKIDEITVRTFDIYADPKRAVSKELAQSISHNLLTIQKTFAN